MRNFKTEVIQELNERAAAKVSKKRRAERSNKRSEGSAGIDLDRAFTLGLADCCPRCGETLEHFDTETATLHLRTCTDAKKHASYKQQQEKEEAVKRRREEKEEIQDSMEGLARWQFLGAKSEQLYLLDNIQLKLQLQERGEEVDGEGERLEMISKLASSDGGGGGSGQLMIDNGDGSSGSNSDGKANKRRKLNAINIPNLHRMSLEELCAVLASHGCLDMVPKGSSKEDIVKMMEDEAMGGQRMEGVLLLKGAEGAEVKDDSSEHGSDEGKEVKKVKKVKKEGEKERKEAPEVIVLDGAGSSSKHTNTSSSDDATIAKMCTSISTIVSTAPDVNALSFNLIKQSLVMKGCSEAEIVVHKASLKGYAREAIVAEMKRRR